ncbi:HlyD family type I secretion periplasmic adaptor subunit [Alsobacter sp. KACC 23698]|uniref:Membrane fusion protein (MFP) family protein n=1 Tax=Alsobacter sp. KACC 23698 TaxID=3149229 RepID=A0AAU7JK10_9HYPH
MSVIEAPPASSDYRTIAIAGYVVIATCIGGLFLWAGLTKLDSAVVANASVSLDSRRKVMQHLEGGMIKQINVKEGQLVQEGEVLVRLDDTQARASLDLVRNQLDAVIAQEARLIAERDVAAEVTYPEELNSRASSPSVRKIIDDQNAQFRERRNSLRSQIDVLQSRVHQLETEIEGLKREGAAAEQQLFFINDELVGVRDLADKGLVAKTRRNALEREKARLDGVIGRNQIDESKARNNINEVRLQVNQLQQKLQEDVAASMQETRQKMSDLREKIRVSEDVLRRTELTAPRAGIVQNVKISTIGQVLRPGESLLEIVPTDDQLVVEAQVPVTDVDRLQTGQAAEIRFPNFHSRTTPTIMGQIRNLSRDRLVDEASRQPYFLAQVAVSDTDIPEEMKARLRAGMPAEVVFPSGERTALEYMIHPLKEAFAKGFRER